VLTQPKGKHTYRDIYLIFAVPGGHRRRHRRLVIIHPVNWCFGQALPRLQLGSSTAPRASNGKSVGWTLRLSVIVLVVYVASSA